MKKKLTLIIMFFATSACVLDQNIGINSTGAVPAVSAMLNISSSDKGLLVPRVALTASNVASHVAAPATSLLVYNTATVGTTPNHVLPGYYYWDGATNPEKLLIDAGVTTSYNLITAKGSIDNYLQINVKNTSAKANASSYMVATATNGYTSTNYSDTGINSGSYTNISLPVLGGATTAYLCATGADFVICNGTATRPLRFFTGGFRVFAKSD